MLSILYSLQPRLKQHLSKMKKYSHILGIIGFLLAIYGLVSAILYSNVTWYSYFVIGGTLFLAWINQILKNDSIFEKGKYYLLKTFVLYLIFTVLIEIVGRFILNFWNYPSFNLVDKLLNVFLIGYPFAFFFIHESFKLIRRKVPSLSITIILATLINAFAHEVPNIFAWEWVYTIPYVTFSILQINIVVIVGWVVLIAIPLITKRILQ
jgi:hypothetical protein